eukprot:365558-Chlamydomonas_euryale.AAC.9
MMCCGGEWRGVVLRRSRLRQSIPFLQKMMTEPDDDEEALSCVDEADSTTHGSDMGRTHEGYACVERSKVEAHSASDDFMIWARIGNPELRSVLLIQKSGCSASPCSHVAPLREAIRAAKSVVGPLPSSGGREMTSKALRQCAFWGAEGCHFVIHHHQTRGISRRAHQHTAQPSL